MTDSTPDNCIFCKIIKGEIPSTKVYETEEVLAFNDISPCAPHHIVIVPKNHIGTLEEINEQNYDITGKLILAAAKIARQKKLDGYRLVLNCNEIAGQTIFHIHCHLLAGRQMGWPPG
jgi:histidine triad (HIT) family protein